MSTYTCPHCGQHDLSTQRRHNCSKLPSLSIPLGPPRETAAWMWRRVGGLAAEERRAIAKGPEARDGE